MGFNKGHSIKISKLRRQPIMAPEYCATVKGTNNSNITNISLYKLINGNLITIYTTLFHHTNDSKKSKLKQNQRNKAIQVQIK